PEVEPVHVAMVEPEPDVMGMVDALAGPRIERKSPGDERAFRRADGIQHRLFQRRGPDIRRERLAVDRDVDALGAFIDLDVNSAGGGEGAAKGGEGDDAENEGGAHETCSLWAAYFSGKVCRT